MPRVTSAGVVGCRKREYVAVVVVVSYPSRSRRKDEVHNGPTAQPQPLDTTATAIIERVLVSSALNCCTTSGTDEDQGFLVLNVELYFLIENKRKKRTRIPVQCNRPRITKYM